MSRALIPAQGMMALIALAFWPPSVGEMMLVPLTGADTGSVLKAALAGGALMVSDGPLPGSIVVVGNRSAIARAAGWRILVTAAPPSICGGQPVSGART